MRRLAVAVVAAMTAVLMACQGHTSVRASDIRTITDRLHCTRTLPAHEQARQAVDCQLDTRNEVLVLTFTSNRNRDNWRRRASGTFDSGVYVTGSKWLVQTDNRTIANRVRKALGTGKVDGTGSVTRRPSPTRR